MVGLGHGHVLAVARARARLQTDPGATRVTRTVAFKAVQVDRQLAYGAVYEPYLLDTQGEWMRPDQIEAMAHKFMLKQLNSAFDVMHDNQGGKAHVVESFIARKGDPDYVEGSWVLGVWVPDRELWARIRKGEIGGFSFEAYVVKNPTTITVDASYRVQEVA